MWNTTAALLNISNGVGEIIDKIPVPVSIICLISICGNVISLLFLKFSSNSHKWRPFYRFVGALALTDLFTILSSPPITLVQFYTGFTYVVTPQLCQYFAFSSSFGILSSAFIICFMSLDRYDAISRPFDYHSKSNNYKTNIIVVLIWFTSACVCVLPLVGLGNVKPFGPVSWCFIDFSSSITEDRVYTYIYAVICLSTLLSTFVMNCLVIYCLTRKSSFNDSESNSGRKHNMSAVILMLVFVMAFGICLTPLTIKMLLSASINPGGSDGTGSGELAVATLAMTNGIIDPWIYILLRKENILACLKCCRCRRSIGTSKTNSGEKNTAAISNTERVKKQTSSTCTATAETHM